MKTTDRLSLSVEALKRQISCYQDQVEQLKHQAMLREPHIRKALERHIIQLLDRYRTAQVKLDLLESDQTSINEEPS